MTTDETGTTSRSVWNPTRVQLDAYRTREVEMAKLNFERGVLDMFGKRSDLRPEDTLHSYYTVCQALGVTPRKKAPRG